MRGSSSVSPDGLMYRNGRNKIEENGDPDYSFIFPKREKLFPLHNRGILNDFFLKKKKKNHR